MSEFPIKEYFNQILRRKNAVILFALLVLLITIITTLKQPKIFQTYAVIEIGSETPDVAFFQDVVNTDPYGWWSAIRYYETQYSILKSRELMKKVAKYMHAHGHAKDIEEDALVGILSGGLTVAPEENSRLARIYFEDTNAARAALFANSIAEAFVEENLNKKLKGIQDAIDWLNARLREIREERAAKETELAEKKKEYRVVSVSDQENLAKANLRALTDTLNRIKSERIEQQAQYEKLLNLTKQHKSAETLLGLLQSSLLEKLADQLAQLKTERSNLASKYLEKHPQMVKIDTQIEEVRKLINQEVLNEVNRLKTKYLLSKAEEESVSKELESQKLEVLKIDEINHDLQDIALLSNTNQQIYETLLKKLKEADLSGLVRSNNIRVVDSALVPGGPIRPDIRRNILFAILFGLLGGVALALALEYIDDTIKNHDDLSQIVKEPLLSIVPTYAPLESLSPTGKKTEEDIVSFIPHLEPQAVISEFYRSLRTNLLFLLRGHEKKSILFTSTAPSEGKTVTAVNTAIVLSQLGKKVIVIDLDFRKPRLHQIFQSDRMRGVTNVILGEYTLEEAIQQSTVPGLDFLTSGSVPPNPAELIGCPETRDILMSLCKRYDYVLVDSAPIAPVTDAIVLSQIVDGVLLVVRSATTHKRAISYARDQLRKVQANILGVVLNDVDINKSTYGSYQYYKYGYKGYADSAKSRQVS